MICVPWAEGPRRPAPQVGVLLRDRSERSAQPGDALRAAHGTRPRGCVAGPELRRARAGTQPVFVVTACRSAGQGRAATGQRSGSPLRALAVVLRVVEWWWATLKLAALIVLVGLTAAVAIVEAAGYVHPHRTVDFRHNPSPEKPDAPTAAVQAQPGRLQLSGDPTWESN